MTEVELPADVLEAIASLGGTEERKPDRLEALAQAIAVKRGDAVKARRESGIEEQWIKAEEAYLGIDDSNRATFVNARWAKPISTTGPLVITGTPGTPGEVKSTAFVRMTSRYVDAGAAKVGEITLPAGDKAFSFSATPVPDMIAGLNDNRVVTGQDGTPLERDAQPGETGQPGAPLLGGAPAGASPQAPGSPPPGVPLKVKDLVQEQADKANSAAKAAEKRIYDWMVESGYRAQMRKVIFDSARIGVGVLKGPFPQRATARALKDNAVVIKSEIKPGYAWKDPWHIYPDPTCGENIQNGDYLLEVDFFSKKQLRKLKGQPGSIDANIDRVLMEDAKGMDFITGKPEAKSAANKNRYPIWYFYGTLTDVEYNAAASASGQKFDAKKTPKEVYAIVTVVNDVVVRASMNPLDSGELPYHSVSWSRRAGHWAGVGVGEQIEMPQRAVNAATRALLNNAGKSSGSIIAIDDEVLLPADGNYTITPDKMFRKKPGASMDDVRKAFVAFEIPNRTKELLLIVDHFMRVAEEVTNIPLVTQGQSGSTTPETYGGMALQNNNANQLLRNIGFAIDDGITEPVVNQSYEFLLLDPNVPEAEKGDWHIDAHGSQALVERAIQDETIQQMGNFVLNPAFGVDPKRWFAQYSKTKHLDPRSFQYSDEEQAKIDQTPPPPAPAVQVAQIRSADKEKELQADQAVAAANAEAQKAIQQMIEDGRRAVAEMRKETDEMRVRRDTDRDTIYVQAETERTRAESAARMEELRVRERLAMLDYANKKDLSLEQVKADLAKTEMTLQVQRELTHATNAAKTGAEPPGKAPNGESFTK